MDENRYTTYAFIGVNQETEEATIECFATDDELIAHIASLALYAKQERNICINQILLDYYYAMLTSEVEEGDENEY